MIQMKRCRVLHNEGFLPQDILVGVSVSKDGVRVYGSRIAVEIRIFLWHFQGRPQQVGKARVSLTLLNSNPDGLRFKICKSEDLVVVRMMVMFWLVI